MRKALDGRAVGLMVFFCAVLGMQQIAIKAAAPDMAPVLQVAIRSGAAAILVGLYLRVKGRALLPGREKWLAGFAAGALFSLEYLFIAEGLRFTNASRMVVMLYTAPAFAALALHFLIPAERLRTIQWCGMAMAFCGIAFAFYDKGASPHAATGSVLLGDFLGLLAGISWGATTVVIRTNLSETPAAQTTFIQLLTCFLVLLPVAALTGQLGFTLSAIALASLSFQVLLVCFVGMLLWFWLLTVYHASQLGALCFMTPIFGIVFGVVLLREAVAPQFILGAAMVLSGIALVSGGDWFWQRATHRRKLAKA